jgi:hypothetical protein
MMIEDDSLFLDFDIDFKLIAIRTEVTSHKLCYFINKISQSELGRIEDIDLFLPTKNKAVYFPVYTFQSEGKTKTWYLIQNIIQQEFQIEYHQENEPLFKEVQETIVEDVCLIKSLEGVRYFLQIYPPQTVNDAKQIVNKIDALEFVDRAFLVDPNQISEIQNILIH